MLDYAPRLDRNGQDLLNLSSGWSWIASPSVVNQFTAQFLTWTHDNEYPDCPLVEGCLIQKLVFPTVSTGPVSGGGFPHWFNFEDKWQFRNDTSIQTGSHAWKFGADYSYLPKHGGIYGPGSPGSIAFFHDPSIILSNSNGLYPQGLQTPGIVRSITLTGEPIGNYDSYGSWTFSGYLQDDWRIGSRLTLNLGLRYDVYEHMNQGDNRYAENRTYKVLRDIGHPMGGLPQTDTDNFGPRAGMAWDMRGDGTRVMRGSFGRYFTLGIKNSYYLAAIQDKPTLFLTQNRTNSAIGQGRSPATSTASRRCRRCPRTSPSSRAPATTWGRGTTRTSRISRRISSRSATSTCSRKTPCWRLITRATTAPRAGGR